MGFMGVDWTDLIMTFVVNGSKVTIRGDPGLTRAEVSLKMLAKSWRDSDQGFLIELRGLSVNE